MITVIAGTNRPDSMTLRTANVYIDLLREHDTDAKLLSLEHRVVWQPGHDMDIIEQQYLIPAEKFIIIMPEYHASFPGILKVMMDNSDAEKCWWHKKALLTGIAAGRAGNMRGVEHMTSILHYMKVNVHYNKVLLSRVFEEISAAGKIIKPATELLMREQVKQFLAF